MKRIKYFAFLFLIASVVNCANSSDQPVFFAATDLAFPYQDASLLGDESHCYGIFPWNPPLNTEIHAGIDLAARYKDLAADETRKVPIVAPVAGKGYYVYEMPSGKGAASILVLLQMNDYWFLAFTFEPQSMDAATNTMQRTNLTVDLTGLDCTSSLCHFPVKVSKGDLIGNLIVRNVMAEAYPHIHYGLLYKSPGQTLENALANNIAIARNEGSNLPPRSGLGSPVTPVELSGTPTTFYCPYEYSSGAAKTIMDGMTKRSNTTTCSCVCAYNSTGGNCGVCP